VADSFDLYVLPLYRVKGKEWAQMPGLVAVTPPRRVARSREGDQLLIYLSLAGNAPVGVGEYQRLAGLLSEHFYKTPGAVTSALRSAAEQLNAFLFERNMRTKGQNQHLLGRLVLAVLRGGQVFLARCGTAYVFSLGENGLQRLGEEGNENRALGSSQATPVSFAQLSLQSGTTLVACAALPEGWLDALQSSTPATIEALRRKLLAASPDDLGGILIQARPGKGGWHILTPRTEEVSATAAEKREDETARQAPVDASTLPAEAPSAEVPPRPTSQVVREQPASRFARLLAGQANEETEQKGGEAEKPASPRPIEGTPASSARPPLSRPAAVSRPAPRPKTELFTGPNAARQDLPELIRPATARRQMMFRSLAKSLRGARVFFHQVGERLRAFLPHLLPDLRSEEPKVTGTSLAFLAIAIPVLVVTVALVFYNQHGLTVSYEENYRQAIEAAAWAATQTDPANIRVGWEQTLYYLDMAERYQQTDDSRRLRQQAQSALDALDGILRLEFAPAVIGGVNRSLVVSEMAATLNDLYLLDAASGSVVRYYAGAQGYQMDTAFVCRPGMYNEINVGPLVDIVAAPKVNPYNATLIAVDARGVLLYCAPSPSRPIAVQLAAPELGLKGIKAIALDMTTDYLYALDAANSAVWYYVPDEAGKYMSLPIMFFGEQVPAGMNSVIDFATNGSDLYLLFEDGHIAACTLIVFENVPKRCVNPVTFVDNRPEHQPGERLIDATFTQMMFADAPDQSLYLFDPYSQAVYRFSPRADSLILLNQFRAAEDQRRVMMDLSAMSMTISPNRSLFISVTGQVYYAADIP
jgi:hypothetical protein